MNYPALAWAVSAVVGSVASSAVAWMALGDLLDIRQVTYRPSEMVNAWAHVRLGLGLLVVHVLFFLVGVDAILHMFPDSYRSAADYGLLIGAAYLLVALIIFDHIDRLRASRLDRGGR